MTKRLKKFVAIATLMASFMMIASPVDALTAEELAEQIATLQAQLLVLTAQLAELTGEEAVVVSGCDISSFDRNLELGDTGDDVKCLQIVLNSDSDTQLTDSGVGSSGEETSYFGPLTKAAVIKFQELYADDVLASWGLTAGTGFVGSTSRAKLNELLVGAVADDEDEDEDEEPVVEGDLTATAIGPVASTVVTTQTNAELLDIVFAGSGTVTAITFKRIGVSADSTLSSVYLYDGATRLTDAASVSSGNVTFTDPNGLFVVSGSRTISVKATLVGTAGETIGVQLTSVTLAGGTVNGLPLSGNLHSVATATLAGLAVGTVLPSSATNADPGNDVRVWEVPFTITTRDVTFTRMALRQINSIVSADIGNFRLYVDGVQIGSAVASLDSNSYVTFSGFTKTLTATAHTIKVLADVTGGSSRIIQMSLRNMADIDATDSQYGVGVPSSGTIPASTANITVTSGSMTVIRNTDSTSGSVTNSASDISLASYTFTAFGEPIKIETLAVALDTSGTDASYTLRNGKIMMNGSQYGSTTGLVAAGISTTAATFTVNFVVNPGSPATIEIRGDIFDEETAGAEFVAGDTLQVSLLDTNASNATRQVSLGTLDVPTGADVTGNILTITTGEMALAKDQSYGSQSVVVPISAFKVGQWVLSGSSTEDINLSTFQIDLTVAGAFASGELTNLYLKYGSKTSSQIATPTTTAGANTWSISELLPKNGTLVFEAYASIITAATDGGTDDTVIPSLKVSGTTASSATAVNTNSDSVLAGQTITAVEAGVLTVSLDNGTPQPSIAVAGSTPSDGSLKIKLTGTNEVLYVKYVAFRVDDNADDGVIASMTLWQAQGSGAFTQVSTAKTFNADGSNPGYVSWTLSGSDRITVAKDGTSYILVKPTYVSSSQVSVTGQTPRIVLMDLDAEGTSVLSASGTGGNLVNASGIIVQANSSATYVDSTEDRLDAAITAAATTVTTANGIVFLTGDVIFIDVGDDATWDPATEELMTVVLDGGANLTVTRGAYGTTPVAYAASLTDNIYRLSSATMTTYASIIGNAVTVLKTKSTLSLASDSPTGSSTGGTQRVIFKFNAAAANNAEDAAENKVVLTSFDITTTKSGLTVQDVRVYPSEFDQNSSYRTTCVALSTTEWRCTMDTTGAGNEVVENSSRTYVVRADVGSGTGTNNTLDVSIASLGSSDAAGAVTAGDSVWTDNTTSKSWVDQIGASYIQPSSPLTLGASSGTTDATVPTMSTIVGANGTTAASLDTLDTIVITLSERIDPSNINASLIPGGAAVTGVLATATGGVTGVQADGIITVTNITTFDSGAALAAAASFTTDLTLNAAGTQLTIALNTGTARVITTPAMGTGTTVVGTATVGIKDVNGNVMASATSPTPTGSF